MRVWGTLAAAGVIAGLALSITPANAGGFLFGSSDDDRFSRHKKSEYYRGQPEVRGYRRRVGGYSYARKDKYFFDAFPRIKYGVEPNYATLPSTR